MDTAKTPTFIPPDGGYGWIIVIATTFINISVLPLVQCFGIIFEQDFTKMGITAAQTSFLLHLHSAIYCVLGLIGSPLLKKYDFRRVALLGTTLMCTGIFLSAFGHSYAVLICTFSLLLGVGQGIMLPATYLATNTYFKKRLTLAVSFSVTGASISYTIMPLVCTKLLEKLKSTQNVVLVLGCISLTAIICCCFLRPVNKKRNTDNNSETLNTVDKENGVKEEDANKNKEELELLNSTIYKETTMPVKKKSVYATIYGLFNLELLNQRPYVITIIGMSISFASELNVILMISFMLPELASFSRKDVALTIMIQSIADIIGRLVIPLIGHKFSTSPRVMYAGSLITATVGRTAIAIFYKSKLTIFFCAILLGLAKGTKAVYQSVIIPRYVTLEKLPAANGLNMLLTGLMSLSIGPVLGAIHDVTNSYVYALHAGSYLSLSCVVLWIVDYILFHKKDNEMTSS